MDTEDEERTANALVEAPDQEQDAHNEDEVRKERWANLPGRVLPEDMVESQDDAAPPVDLGLDLNRENWIRYV